MYITIITQDRPIALDYPIDNECGNLQVALHEIVYKVKWFNISEAKENNWIQVQDGQGYTIKSVTIDDGYYGFCALKEELSEAGIELKLNNANLKITLTFKPEQPRESYNFAGGLAKMLGFETNDQAIHNFAVATHNRTFEGQNPIDLAINSLLYVHLNELNTNENLYDGRPSTVLRVIPAGSSAYCVHEIKTFTNLQFKPLVHGHHEKLNLRITDQTGKRVRCDDLHVVLEIK